MTTRRLLRRARWPWAALLAVALVAFPLEAQRVVPSRPLALPTAEAVRVELRRAIAGPDGRARTMFFAHLLENRGDSLVVLPLGDTASAATWVVPVDAVARVQVRERTASRARLDAAGETAFYSGMLGAMVGGVVAAVSSVGRNAGVGYGALIGAGAGFVLGIAARPPGTYGVRWHDVTFTVER